MSYNTYPGRYPRQMIREILLYQLRGITEPAARLASARAFLPKLDHPEAKALLELSDDSLCHDDLAPINDPVWFHEFAAHAQRHGLQYLGEADLAKTFATASGSGDSREHILEREQHLDFLQLRRFRQTLLCRGEIALDRDVSRAGMLNQMDGFLFSNNLRGQRVEPGDGPFEAVVNALRDTAPLPAAFDELIAYAGTPETLREILLAMLRTGCVSLHVHDFPCEESVTARPCASRLVRYQAALGGDVTSACHLPVALDDIGRSLALLLDGNRTHEEIARDLSRLPGAPTLDEVRQYLPASLAWFARMGLLE